MERAYILVQDDLIKRSLQRYFRHACGINVASRARLNPRPQNEDAIISDRWAVHAFKDLAEWFESAGPDATSENGLRNALAITDLVSEDLPSLQDLNPLQKKADTENAWSTVVSMLMLAFPEVHWLFITPHRAPTGSSLKRAHVLNASSSLKHCLTLRNAGYTPLFDPTALRDAIRRNMRAIDRGAAAGQVPYRSKAAAAIDDEDAYAYFNAYAAYRFGYRSCPVASWTLMKEVCCAEADDIHLSLEDLYLGFADRPEDISLSNLKQRDEEHPKLKDKVKQRAIITVGHHRTGEPSQPHGDNQEYLCDLREKKGVKINELHKPLAGIFDLWEKVWEENLSLWKKAWEEEGYLAAFRSLVRNICATVGGLRNSKAVLAEGYEWPPDPKKNRDAPTGHSTPGRLLAIAGRLIERSKKVLGEAQNVPDAVYAATLAVEAKELLAGKTPTTALEALALQHRAEVVSECMFYGIEYNLDVQTRFQEIQREVEAIGHWFNEDQRKRSTINVRLSIAEELARTFHNHNQFEEEQQCLAEARDLAAKFWIRQKPWRRLLYPLLWYINSSLRSLTTFVSLVTLWIIAFGFVYYFSAPFVASGAEKTVIDALGASTVFFFTLSGGGGWIIKDGLHTLWNIFLSFQGMISFLHLSLLISHIYMIVSRR